MFSNWRKYLNPAVRLLRSLAWLTAAAACHASLASGVDAALAPPIRGAGFRCWYDVPYGERPDYPDEGEGFKGRIGGWYAANMPVRICRHCSGQRLDLYVPDGVDAADAVVVMYVHGGTWSHCFDKGAIPGMLFRAFMDSGVVLCSPNYILQVDNTMNVSEGRRDEATFSEMLRDIDKAVSRLKALLPEVGVRARRFVMSGESAGAHLALLYAYDQDNPGPLGLGLRHEMRIERMIDIAGPTDFSAMDDSEIAPTDGLVAGDPRRPIRMLIKRLSGLADDAPDAEVRAVVAKWSPVGLVTAKSVPTFMAYGKIMTLVRTDGLIPLGQMDRLERALKAAGVVHESKVFSGVDHGSVSTKGREWIAECARRELAPRGGSGRRQ